VIVKRTFYIGLFALLAIETVSASQSIALTRSHAVWDRRSGFPGGYVYSIAQTADGYLWVAASKGLVRYDGLRFVFIPRGDSPTPTNAPVTGLVTDSNDQIWATDDHTHLFRYEPGRLRGPLPDNGKHRYLPSSLTKTFDGWLLFASELQGLVEYRNGGSRVLLEPKRLPISPTSVAQTEDGTVWIGTREQGLFRFNPGKGDQELQKVPGLVNTRINNLLAVANATLLIATNRGLFVLRNDVLHEVHAELDHREILALANGRHGEVWIGTAGHVFRALAKNLDAADNIGSLERLEVNGAVTALFEDRDGNLWIGEPDTVERYRDSSFVSYLSSTGLPCTNCGAIYVDAQENVWFAPWDGGFFRISHGRVQPIELDGLGHDIVYSIVGVDDEVWVARRYGGLTLLRLNGDVLKTSTHFTQRALFQEAVYSLYRESDGTVWAGTLNGGLRRFHSGNWEKFTTDDGLPSNTITTITGNSAGQIFVGTPNGLAELRDDRWISYNTHDGLPPGAIESLVFDDTNTLWIGTSKGVAFLRSGAIHVPLGAPNALYGDIHGMAEHDGWLWITTSDHVLRVKCSALLKQEFGGGAYREFGITDGLASEEGVKRPGSVVLDNRGNVWFSVNHGISVLRRSAFAGPAFPITIRIEGILVDGKSAATLDQAHISSGRHRLTFQYAGVNVSNPEGVKYHYRLNDVDSGWSEPTSLREIDFTNVLPGRYQFQVAASNADGVWSPHEAVIAFEVEPSLLQTRWAQIAIVGILALLALGVYQLRVQQLRRQFNIGFEARVNERTRIARDLHDTLLQTLHGLMFQFQAVRNLLPRRTEEAMKSLDDAIHETEKALAESRDAIQGLRSEPIAKGNLAELLMATSRELVHSAHTNHAPPVFDLIEEGERRDLSPTTKNEVCRIALEILRNAYRHAQASRIETEVRYGDHSLRIRIRDDGKGIDPNILKEGGLAGHWGLRGIRERATRIGAQLDFWSETGAGTEVQLTVPASVAYETSRTTGATLLRKDRNRE
jgi:ligand-binding sensor domain-containing protein/signal transduction histidine kinase